MKLKNKTLTFLSVVIIFLIVSVYIVERLFILPVYSDLEKSESIAVLDVCQKVLQDDQQALLVSLKDWSYWDDAYMFVQDKNTENFIKNSLSGNTLSNASLNIMMFFNSSYKMVWGDVENIAMSQKKALDFLSGYLKTNSLLLSGNSQEVSIKGGIINTPFGMLVLGISPILQSNNKGQVQGTLVMGRVLSNKMVQSAEDISGAAFKILSIGDASRLNISKEKMDQLLSGKKKFIFKTEEGSKNIDAISLMKDVAGNKSFILQSTVPRDIYFRGKKALSYSIIALIIVGIILIVVLAVFIQFNVTNPLTYINNHLLKIRGSDKMTDRLPILVRDKNEINYLTNEFNLLMKKNESFIKSLELKIADKSEEVDMVSRDAIFSIADAVESKDTETGAHTLRISAMAKFIAKECELPPGACEEIGLASTLHDVGKIGIPDSILLKGGALTEQEFDVIKTHTLIGAKILGNRTSKLMKLGCEIACSHHERWDGKGYPYGLASEEIPLPARITTLVDVFDALLSKRSYKSEWDNSKVEAYIIENSGKIFDPKLVEIFKRKKKELFEIRNKYQDA